MSFNRPFAKSPSTTPLADSSTFCLLRQVSIARSRKALLQPFGTPGHCRKLPCFNRPFVKSPSTTLSRFRRRGHANSFNRPFAKSPSTTGMTHEETPIKLNRVSIARSRKALLQLRRVGVPSSNGAIPRFNRPFAKSPSTTLSFDNFGNYGMTGFNRPFAKSPSTTPSRP